MKESNDYVGKYVGGLSWEDARGVIGCRLGWLPTKWVGGGYGCVWIGKRQSGPGLRHHWCLGGYPPGSLREIWAQGQETGAAVAWAKGVGFFFPLLLFSCPVRDEAMGTSPEEGV